MALKTGKEYRESLKELSPEVYVRGEKVDNVVDHPLLKQTINHAATGYDLIHDLKYKDKALVESPFTGSLIPRLQTHIQQNKEDLFIKAELIREISATMICSGCMSNMLSVTWAMIYDIDEAHGTDYFPRYQRFIQYLQDKDERVAWCMMDTKGDRSLSPSKQKEPIDLRIVRREPGGIVVNGTKIHTTFGPASHHVMVVPCRALGEEDKDFAVSFVLPIDTKGIKMIARPSPGPVRDVSMENPLSSKFLAVEATTIFDDVFVPEENLFMCGEWQQAMNLPLYFASLHRQSKCACSAGHCDLFAGTAALCAEVNGLGMKVSHLRDKITDMILHAETGFGCSLGAAAKAQQHPSGVWLPDALIANSGLNTIRSSIGKHMEYLHDIGGGLIVTLPTEADWNNPELQPYLEKGFKGSESYSTEDRLKAVYLAQDLAASRATGTIFGFTVNASGSPETNKVVVRNMYDLDKQINLAKEIASIEF